MTVMAPVGSSSAGLAASCSGSFRFESLLGAIANSPLLSSQCSEPDL